MTLHYEFPRITHINDVLPAVEDHPDFVTVKKDGYTVINYVVMNRDTFDGPDPWVVKLRRECRGLIFDEDGHLAARRFHKFFNVGEAYVPIESVDLSKPHRVLEKLDGSMISPVIIGGHVRWTTRMGITHVAMEAEAWVQQHDAYREFAEDCLNEGLTPIFEWCSRRNKIVLDYPEDRLVLLGVRDIESGIYAAWEITADVAEAYGIEIVGSIDTSNVTDVTDLIAQLSEVEDQEGVVIRFDDGHMIKIKTPWYVALHKSKDALRFERNLVELILYNQLDDLMPVLQAEDRTRVTAYVEAFHAAIGAYTVELLTALDYWRGATGGDRKTFAIESEKAEVDPLLRSFLFKVWDTDAKVDTVCALIREAMMKCYVYDKQTNRRHSTQPTFDRKVKPIIASAKWTDWLAAEAA